MSSTFLPRKSDKETGLPVRMSGKVKSGWLRPTLGAYASAKADVVVDRIAEATRDSEMPRMVHAFLKVRQ